MRRLQLFEWGDQPWLPRVFRDFITDHLRYTHSEPMREPVNRAIAARLASLLARASTTDIVDLCAGAGGPVPKIGRILAEDLSVPVRILVTDLYPNVAAFQALEALPGGRIIARYESTDAGDVPAALPGLRTLFLALHHFQPAGVRMVLSDAVRKRAPIAVFEPLERTLRMMTVVGVLSFLRGFTHTHRVGRMSMQRFLLTYLLPILPAMFAWDGMVSSLRTYTADELLQMAKSVTAHDYDWEAGRFDVSGPLGPMPTTFLVGLPSPSGQAGSGHWPENSAVLAKRRASDTI